jgi:hypothetical protein
MSSIALPVLEAEEAIQILQRKQGLIHLTGPNVISISLSISIGW